MKVYLSELAAAKLLELSEYLLQEWDAKTRDKFISKLNERIKQISHQPESCPKSSKHKNLYRCVVTNQTTFFYRVSLNQGEIEIITFFDTRQDPRKLNKVLGKK